MPIPESARERILNSAERMFARHGFEATSLRAIIVEAKVNLASVHYYFGSKEGLFRAVFQRRFTPVNQERLRLLEVKKAAAGRPPSVEQILEAFPTLMISVGLKKSRHKTSLLQLAGRILLEQGTQFEGPAAECLPWWPVDLSKPSSRPCRNSNRERLPGA
ncbi:MAG: TetR family transcriptional regulator [Terriglobia bacterium]